MEHRKDSRKGPKRAVDNNVTYQTISEYPVITGEGTLLDISENGCRVGGTHALRKDVRIQMAVRGKPGEPVTVLDNCKVAWIKDEEFGAQIIW